MPCVPYPKIVNRRGFGGYFSAFVVWRSLIERRKFAEVSLAMVVPEIDILLEDPVVLLPSKALVEVEIIVVLASCS